MKNKKGFTLIELLAVIAVLAIILVIATPQVIKAINNSRNEAFLTSYKNLVGEVKNRIVEKRTNKDIEIECSDYSEKLSDDRKLRKCSEVYGLSATDYIANIIEVEDNYLLFLEGTGKFKNINLLKYENNLKKDNFYLMEVGSEEKSDKSIFSIISSYGKVLNYEIN